MADIHQKSFSSTEFNQADGDRDGSKPDPHSPDVTIDHDPPRGPSFLADSNRTGRRQRRAAQSPKPPGYLVLGVRGAIVLGLVIFVALLWAFVMGMFYGRGTEFQEKGYRELTALFFKDQAAIKTTPKKDVPAQPEEQTPKKDKTEDVMPELEKDVVGWLADPTPPHKPAPEPKPEPEPKPIPKPVVKPTPAPKPTGAYTVQVAATKNEEEARAAVNDLKSKGFNAYFYHTLVSDRNFYRVRVGNFDNREKAIEEISKLTACGYPDGYIARMTEE
jgi:hypothetical protein